MRLSAIYQRFAIRRIKLTITALVFALALTGFSFVAQAGKIISMPSASGAPGFGGWNLDNIEVVLNGTGASFDKITGAYDFGTDSDFTYEAQVFAAEPLTSIELGTVLAKNWPVGEPSGIKIVNDDFDVKEGRPSNCIISTSYLAGHYLDSTAPKQVLCSGPFQSHKRYKLAMLPASITAGAGAEHGIDLVFNVEADGTTRDYQVFQKINNWTGQRLQGFSIQVGTGQGAGFVAASAVTGVGIANLSLSVPGAVWAADQLVNFSTGLFGPIDTKHGRPAGYFDPVNPAGFYIAEYPINRGQTDTLNSGEPLPSAYAGVPAGAAVSNQFGAWLPNSMLPYGIYFDDDNNPETDPELIAWYGYNPNLASGPGFSWMKGAADNFATIPDNKIINQGANLAYTMALIDDLVNLGLNYIVTIGDISGFPGYDASPELNSASFTLRITPKVQNPQTAAPGFVAAGTPVPSLEFKTSNGVVVIDPGETFNAGDLLVVRVGDADLNNDSGTIDTVDVSISSSNGLSGTLTLLEQGKNRGVFAASLPDAYSDVPADTQVTITVEYIDQDDGLGGANVIKVASTTSEIAAPAGSLQFNPASYTVAENAGNVIVTVERTDGDAGEITVEYQTVSGTAIGGLDYVADSGNLTFADGVTTQTIRIQLLIDALAESDETFSILLSNVQGGGTMNTASSAEITITNAAPATGSDSGGFCSYQPNGRFDPVLPALILAALVYLGWRRQQRAA